MSQSTLQKYFNPTREGLIEKQRNQLSINFFAVPIIMFLPLKLKKMKL